MGAAWALYWGSIIKFSPFSFGHRFDDESYDEDSAGFQRRVKLGG